MLIIKDHRYTIEYTSTCHLEEWQVELLRYLASTGKRTLALRLLRERLPGCKLQRVIDALDSLLQ